MNSEKRDLSFLDRPEITRLIFYPRKQIGSVRETEDSFSLSFYVDKDVEIVGRFYRTEKYQQAPTILFFHGNGEIATDYDFIGPSYQQMGINFFVADYRGYGLSGGEPSFSSMVDDAHSIFHSFREWLVNNEFGGPISIMGRSLGSASAIELANIYQTQLSCLIIESGFVYTYNLLRRLGIPSSFLPPKLEELASTLPLIKTVKIPTLVIHGEIDVIIPLEDGIALYKNLASEDMQSK
jgi:pimeloyl-ACP methyl ester carboxylesterase